MVAEFWQGNANLAMHWKLTASLSLLTIALFSPACSACYDDDEDDEEEDSAARLPRMQTLHGLPSGWSSWSE